MEGSRLTRKKIIFGPRCFVYMQRRGKDHLAEHHTFRKKNRCTQSSLWILLWPQGQNSLENTGKQWY